MFEAGEEKDAVAQDDRADGGTDVTPESIVEAILFAADSPVSAAKVAQILESCTASEVKKHIAALNDRYEAAGASFRIEEIANGFQMMTLPPYNVWLSKLLKVRKDSKLSPAALETLAVVAYKQPVIRVTIEEIRGVAVGDILLRLREMNLIKIVGRAEEIGRPMLYGTTRRFLEVFGLASLEDLPKVEVLTPPEKQSKAAEPEPELFDSQERAPNLAISTVEDSASGTDDLQPDG